MAGNTLIVFSYEAAAQATENPQNITLKAQVMAGPYEAARVSRDVAIEAERAAGRDADSFLCKPEKAAIDAKIEWFAESLAWNFRSVNGQPAVITVERV